MKARNIFFSAALVLVTATVTTQVVSQNTKDKPGMAGHGAPPGMPQLTPEQEKTFGEMMQKCTVAGTPGENHKNLNAKVGKWNGVVKMWMMPEVAMPDSNCTSECKWIMGDRFLSETVEGSFADQTFMGQSWGGYDNITKKYTWVWIDNMGTGMMSAEGTYDPTSKTFKYGTEMSCPMTGKEVKGRTVEKWTDNDHFVMEMYGPWYQTGKEYKTMEIHYTRAK